MKLATRFGRGHTSVRSHQPLTNEQIASVAPSIFATEKHDSRSERYTYIPTIEVLEKLRSEGFMPFMACQARCRDRCFVDGSLAAQAQATRAGAFGPRKRIQWLRLARLPRIT